MPYKANSLSYNSYLIPQDEWLECQRNWLYLESIFGAPDIQRQLPNEAKMFTQVDKSWKDIMRRVQKIPNCISAGTRPGVCMCVPVCILMWYSGISLQGNINFEVSHYGIKLFLSPQLQTSCKGRPAIGGPLNEI